MEEPPTSQLLCRIDPIFVQCLKERLKKDNSGIGIPPFAVVCLSVSEKGKFEEWHKDVYRYEVHGGLHGIMARKEIAKKEDINQSSLMVWCHVYACLPDEEALWLASRHNFNGHFNHRMSHRNYVCFNL